MRKLSIEAKIDMVETQNPQVWDLAGGCSGKS